MKNQIILNEYQYVRQTLSDVYSDKNGEIVKPEIGFFRFLLLLTKYYCDKEFNYTLGQVEIFVQTTMERIYQKEYIHEKWRTMIKNVYDNLGKETVKPLSRIPYLDVYSCDMIEVFKAQTEREHKLMFSAYVLAHYKASNGWLNLKTIKDIGDWFEMSNLSCTAFERMRMIGELKSQGLLEVTNSCDNLNVRVKMANDYEGMQPVFRITEMRNLGNLLIATYKDGYGMCEKCGKLIKINKGMFGVCKKCQNLTE